MNKDNYFRPGDTVVFEPANFNPEYWNKLSETRKREYYGDLYNFEDPSKPFLFTFICEQKPQYGHCVLVSMDTQKMETMRHINDFRKAREDEC